MGKSINVSNVHNTTLPKFILARLLEKNSYILRLEKHPTLLLWNTVHLFVDGIHAMRQIRTYVHAVPLKVEDISDWVTIPPPNIHIHQELISRQRQWRVYLKYLTFTTMEGKREIPYVVHWDLLYTCKYSSYSPLHRKGYFPLALYGHSTLDYIWRPQPYMGSWTFFAAFGCLWAPACTHMHIHVPLHV